MERKRLNDEKFDELMNQLCDKKHLNAIQVGSNDGLSNDPLRKFIVNNDWNAVLIEPVPNLFNRLVNLYSDNPKVTVLNLA